jgi:hypothetical protein
MLASREEEKEDVGSFKPEPFVHWGICSSTGKPWMYQYKRGWKEASDDDVAFVCENDMGGPFSEICRKH